MGLVEEFKTWSRREGYAVTAILVVTLTLSTLYFFVSQFQGIEYLAYAGARLTKPWTLFTYPWGALLGTGGGLLAFVFLMVWLFWVGRKTEQDIGPTKMAILWFAFTMTGAVFNWLAVEMTRVNSPLLGPMVPVMAITGVWAARNPRSIVRIDGIIPVEARWLGVLAAVLLVFATGIQHPLIGLLDCVPMALGALYAMDRLPGIRYGAGRVYESKQKKATTRGQVMYDEAYFDDVKRREKERAEQERLRKLFGED